MKYLAAVILTLFLPVLTVGETVVVRDRAGRVVERQVKSGTTVRVYDGAGKLLRVEKSRSGQTDGNISG